jgi:hypothetical protein
MPSRIQALQEEHAQLRALLRNCESAHARDFASALSRLEEMFVPHHAAKLAFYDAFIEAFQAAGDKTSVSVLSIFRTNMKVMSSAIQGFLQSPDPDPARSHERFHTVATTLRSMLSTEEKAVFPLCIRTELREGGQP